MIWRASFSLTTIHFQVFIRSIVSVGAMLLPLSYNLPGGMFAMLGNLLQEGIYYFQYDRINSTPK